jgi:hypothetical protein
MGDVTAAVNSSSTSTGTEIFAASRCFFMTDPLSEVSKYDFTGPKDETDFPSSEWVQLG